jgi:uncharacterized protein (TIGR00297 family)
VLHWGTAAGLAVIAAALAARLRLLTPGGAAAAALVGAVALGAGGWTSALLLVLFFSSSSLLTRLGWARKSGAERRRGRRAAQVVANGGLPAVLAVAGGLLGMEWALPALAGALAASTADTWATEVGLLSPAPPRLVTSGAVVEPGRSGGVTPLGTAAGVAGAGVLAVAAALVGLPAAATLLGGVAGLAADSLLGATLQVTYRCPVCGRTLEEPACPCGGSGRHLQGLPGITNDVVNLLASATGAAVAALVA